MPHKFVMFPFSALVGQDLMKKALLVNAVDPGIGGVLIKGDKGTGKSTAVRSLAELLPSIRVVQDCPFGCHPVNRKLMCSACQSRLEHGDALPSIDRKMEVIDMPLSATEDMVVGTLDIKRVLKEGTKAFEPGILARANRNILYIDEVNLLDDHLVNILLDASAMGVNVVEREGISLYHPARFILVGTMNPEEGELRPQILDRFALSLEVKALSVKQERLQVMEYRMAFDADPWQFEERFVAGQEQLGMDIVRAQELLYQVALPQELLEQIVHLTTTLEIKTHRADIAMEKTARALAALDGRTEVTERDIEEAALLALQHRMRQSPFEKNKTLSPEMIEQILHNNQEEEISDFDRQGDIKKNFFNHRIMSPSRGNDASQTVQQRGLYIHAQQSVDGRDIALDATIRKAVRETGALQVLTDHLMEKVRIGKGEGLYILALDSSSSMRLERKIRLAKTLSWLVLKQSYTKRNKVALITFRNEDARVIVEPTADILRLQDALEQLPTGGKTPLTPALATAFDLAAQQQKAAVTVILISDGRGNVFINGSFDEDIEYLSARIPGHVTLTFINTENKNRSVGTLEDLARTFQSPLFYLEDVL
jgi:magnesium chelatase subunit D